MAIPGSVTNTLKKIDSGMQYSQDIVSPLLNN